MGNINEKYQEDISKLNDFEKNIIVNKGTEAPFSSELLEVKDDGVFVCKLCKSPLFDSSSKFNSGTGWPSFDDAIEGAVKEILDALSVHHNLRRQSLFVCHLHLKSLLLLPLLCHQNLASLCQS